MRKLLCLFAAGLLVFGVACGGGDDENEPAANEQESTEDGGAEEEGSTEDGSGSIEVVMTEFAFAGPETVPAGEFEVTAVNNGEQQHEMGVVPLKPGAPPIEELVKLSDKELEEYLAGPFGGTEGPIKPGESKTFTLDGSKAASFGFACFIKDPETKKPHVQLGMAGTFVVE